MSLTNMKVFNETIQTLAIEALDQLIDQFNAASAGAIVLTSEGFQGDFIMRNAFSSLSSARRRVDRYASNATQAATSLAQLQAIGVKVAGGFGPVLFEPAQFSWMAMNPADAVEAIASALAEGMLQDQLNTGIAACVAAVEAQTTSTTYDTNTGPIAYTDLNLAHAKFGDASPSIVADVVHSQTYHGLIGLNLANAQNLFQAGGVTVVDILNKRMVVTDAPALLESPSTTTNDVKALGLTAGAITVYDGSDLVTNFDTTNGKLRIESTFQADYSFGVALRGYAWDTSAGGKSPTDTELATGSNWTKVATSIKHTAGVLVIAQTRP